MGPTPAPGCPGAKRKGCIFVEGLGLGAGDPEIDWAQPCSWQRHSLGEILSLPPWLTTFTSPGLSVFSGRVGCGSPFCTLKASRAGMMEADAAGEGLGVAGDAWLTRAGLGEVGAWV